MTYVLDTRPEGALIATEMPEWNERYPAFGPGFEACMRISTAWHTGEYKLEPDEFPKELIIKKPRKWYPDIFKTTGSMYVASGAAKNIIEGLDPELHQFFPLTIHTKRGLEVEGPWFAMHVTEQQDSIVKEKSMVYLPDGSSERLHQFYYDRKDVTVDVSRQSGAHLWREYFFINSLLGSDELINALKAADMKFFRRFKAKDLR